MAVQIDTRVDAIRQQLPAIHKTVYLNTGTNGPLPRAVHQAMHDLAIDELETGRINMDGWMKKAAMKPQARELLAKAFKVKATEIALTQLTTEGMNVMIHGVNWQQGDEAIITNLEHPGGQLPLYVVARRYGVQLKLADLGTGSGDVAGKIESLLTRRTRAVVVSHLAWNTGALLPLKEIVEVCRRQGVLVLVDAAQSAGSVPVDLYDVDPDGYAMPGQKWLCGPEGTGSLYIREDRLGWFQQTYVNYGSAVYGSTDDIGGYFTPNVGAARFDRIATYYPLIAGQVAAMDWLVNEVGMDWAYERIGRLGQRCHEMLSNIDGVEVITPRDRMAGLVSFNLIGFPCDEAVTALGERGFTLRTIPHPACVRVSTGFYNTEEELDNLGEAIQEIIRQGPAASE